MENSLVPKSKSGEIQRSKSWSQDELDVLLATQMEAMEADKRTKLEPATRDLYLTEWSKIVRERGMPALERALAFCMRDPEQKFFPNVSEVRAALQESSPQSSHRQFKRFVPPKDPLTNEELEVYKAKAREIIWGKTNR